MFDTLNEYRVAAERHYQKNGYTFDKDNLSKIVAVMNHAFAQYSREGANKSPNIKMRPCKYLNLMN